MTSLKSQALAGIKWTTASAILSSFLQVVKMAILARLIVKEDFGLFATVAVILGLADFFVEAGLGSAVIHRQDATKEELASAYTINVLLGWLVFIILFFSSSLIAGFYNDQRLIPLIQLASLVFIFQSLGRQYDALMRKDLQFNVLAKVNIFAVFIGFITALFFAFYDFGVKALIFSQLAIVFTRTICLLFLGLRKYGFNIGFYWVHARFFFRFSLFQICENCVNYFNTQLDTILIGKLLGQEALGLFFMAKQLAFKPIQIINPIINKISLPIFAIIQNDDLRLKRGYLQVVHTLALIHFSLFTIIAGFSDEIVQIFLGQTWGNAGGLLKILAFYTMLRAIGNPIGSLLVAKGRVELGFYWNFAVLFYTPPAVLMSSRWGPVGIAYGLFFAMLGLNFLGWYFLVLKLCKASFKEYFGRLFFIAISAFFCFGALFFVEQFFTKIILLLIGVSVYYFIHRDEIGKLRSAKYQ